MLKWNLGQSGDDSGYSYSPSLVETRGLPSGDGLKDGWGIAYRIEDGLLYASDGSRSLY